MSLKDPRSWPGWLTCSSTPASTTAYAEVALDTKACLPPSASAQSDSSLVTQPKTTEPVVSSTFSGKDCRSPSRTKLKDWGWEGSPHVEGRGLFYI